MDCVEDSEDILTFDYNERIVFSRGMEALKQINLDEALMVERRFVNLESLALAISRFPPVCQTQVLGGVRRDTASLAGSLTSITGSSRLLHTPTRVIAARSFLVAKYHAFSLLLMALGAEHELAEAIQGISIEIVFTLTMEDVYLACLEDDKLPLDLKESIAMDLVRLWDRGRDPRASSHIPCIKNLWTVRRENPPSYGTLEGTSELIRINMDMDDDWTQFILSRRDDREMRGALEEFLFGLSHEEMAHLRVLIRMGNVFALNEGGIQNALGKKRSYTEASDADPRLMYEFYIQRSEGARTRKQTGVHGPQRTIEEIYLSYRFAQERYLEF